MTLIKCGDIMEKMILFEPGYDKRSDDPKKNYGISAMKIRFVLRGTLGAMQFLIGTGWYIPSVAKEFEAKAESNPAYRTHNPNGWDIGYHSPKPMYDGQSIMDDNCEIIGGPCYYDGSSLAAESLLDNFLVNGVDAVWTELARYYISRFGELL